MTQRISNTTVHNPQMLRKLLEAMGAHIQTTKTWDPGSLADGAGETTSVTVTGAALGDFVMVSCSADLIDMTLTGYVQAANTVELRLQNESGDTRNLGSSTFYVRVIPYNTTDVDYGS